jgi:transposase
MQVTTIGLDIAKNVFQVHGVDAQGRVVLRKRLARGRVLAFFANLPRCLIGLEACGGAHYWARELRALGHEVRLMPPQYVKAYVKTNKHDAADAEACCEAVQRPGMRFVPVKSADQQALLMLHRVRDQLIGQRTATINALRAHLAELGIVAAQRQAGVRQCWRCWAISRTSASRRSLARCCRCWRRSCATWPTGSPSSTGAWSR